jgi:acetyl esterase/lipase
VVRCLERDVEMKRRASLRLDWFSCNIKDLRAKYERACRVVPQGPHTWLTIPTGGRQIRVLLHEAQDVTDRAIFYFHGGGWIVGSPTTHADISSTLCAYAGIPVISIDYRLAPEYKAPAAIADGIAVLNHFLSGGGAPHQLVTAILCGDSAGGSIAVAVERYASHGLKKAISGVCSLYGSFGLGASRSIELYGTRDDGLDRRCLRRYWTMTSTSSGRGPFSLSALDHGPGCPMYFLVAGKDPLRDDSMALARALKRRGRAVTVDLRRYEGHGFLQQPHRAQSVHLAFQEVSRWICGLCHPRRVTS